MMYEFVDTTEQPGAQPLPAEALKINGEYLENLIQGYRTLTVQGREALSSEISTEEAGLRPGSIYISRKYPERIITVQYQIIAQSPAGFREAYNQLAAVLDVEDARIIFADEPDKYFVGTPGALESVEPGKLAVVSSFQIVCADPFKYSTHEYTAQTMPDGTLYCNYNGTFPAHPRFTAQFLEEGDVTSSGSASTITGNGDCGYIAFFDEDKNILQFGDPDEADGTRMPATQTLLAANLKSSGAWTSAVTSKWSTNESAAVVMNNAEKTGSAGMIPFVASVTDASKQYYTGPISYGSGSAWHGPVISAAIPADKAGDVGAANFMFQFALKCSIQGDNSGLKQIGGIYCFLSDASGNKRYGVRIFKGTTGKTGRIWFIVNGELASTATIDLTVNNKYFGSNRAESYKTVGGKKVYVPAITTNKLVKFTKDNNYLTIDAGGVTRTFKVTSNPVITRISIHFMACGTYPVLRWLGIYNWKFNKMKCDTWKDEPNKFTAGDLLEVDGRDGTVRLNGHHQPALGALGNDWEEFVLNPGENLVGWSCSDWCESPPDVEMKYREVYL